ncbi:MAG: pilin [Minisyncoccia bacterium]
MRRYAPVLLAVITGLLFVVPVAAHAAGIPYFGPIIPNLTCNGGSGGSYQISPLAWGALVTVVNNIIALTLTIAIVFFAPLMIAYAGFLYLTSGASPGNRSQANSVLTNTIVGIVVALAAWIMVDAVMGALYNGSAGSWYSIINSGSGNPCLSVAGSLNSITLPSGQTATITGTGASGGNSFLMAREELAMLRISNSRIPRYRAARRIS